jgi:Concanavalin A-like lectin/glucanases superfamily
VAGAVAASTNPLRIGGNSVWGEFFSGLIDDVRIYNRVLTAAEITTDMNTAINKEAPPIRRVACPRRAWHPTAPRRPFWPHGGDIIDGLWIRSR